MLEVLPGDPAEVMLGTEARPDTLAALRKQYGFDRPAPERYLAWVGGLFRLDLGTSHAYGTPVAKIIGERLQVTLPLGVMALGWATLVAIPLGVFAAARHNRRSHCAARSSRRTSARTAPRNSPGMPFGRNVAICRSI